MGDTVQHPGGGCPYRRHNEVRLRNQVDTCYSEASYSRGRYSWETPSHGSQGRSKHQ